MREAPGGGTQRGRHQLHPGRAEDVYTAWDPPDLIVSDGAYGVGGFPGDPRTPERLRGWYEAHAAAWAKYAHAATTLWFWNTEIGWATVHPLLAESGWEYVQTILWDKGIGHIAGNVNGGTIRRLPTVTEVCVFYRRRLEFETANGTLPARQWLRSEWRRAGLPLREANAACGVRNAATRKYLTQDWLWYFPPPETMERLVSYANEHGAAAGRPYYSIDGERPVTAAEWAKLRHPWNHEHGLTNVWAHPPLNGAERYRGGGRRAADIQPRKKRDGPSEPETHHLHAQDRPCRLERRRHDLGAVRRPVHGVRGRGGDGAERLRRGARPLFRVACTGKAGRRVSWFRHM